jgi:hypothetical protein
MKLKHEADQEERAKRMLGALFDPKITIMQQNNFSGNNGCAVSIGNEGSVQQTVRVDSIALHQQIDEFKDSIETSKDELTDAQRTAAIESLNTIADQFTKPAVEREPSKIMAALKVLPGDEFLNGLESQRRFQMRPFTAPTGIANAGSRGLPCRYECLAAFFVASQPT